MTTQVNDVPDRGRFEITVDGRAAGFAAYRRENDVVTFTHTEVDDAYEGQGLGSQLVGEALDIVRSYVERHPEYQDLLAR